jgi:membrane fusion protein, multidrug efflux system
MDNSNSRCLRRIRFMSKSHPLVSSSSHRRRRAAFVVLGVLALFIAAWLFWRFGAASSARVGQGGFRGGPAGMMTAAVPVKVAQTTQQDITVFIRSLGTVNAYNTVTVRSRVEGELLKVAFEEGKMVKAGDLLVQIDTRAYDVALLQAQGQQQQNLAQLENARRDLQRYQALYKQDSIARQQLDTQASLVRQLEGTRKSDQAAVDNAKLQLSYTRITAPLSGRVGLSQVDKGNLVSTGDTNGLVVITQTQPIAMIFTVPETQLDQVREQLQAGRSLTVEAYDQSDTKRLAVGRLETLDNQIDVTTGTVKLKARFENADDALFPNQFVNARLQVQTLSAATVIPTAAVQQGSVGAFVFLVQADNTVAVRPVTLGAVNGDVVAVLKGLEVGDKVVTEGTDRLRAGAIVELIDASAAAQVNSAHTPVKTNRPPKKQP